MELTLALEGDELCLTVADDGVGFVAAAGRPTSFGLVGMRERVLIMGGRLTLESEPGEGTSLVVRVPVSEV
ncbi:Signal transduction histidine-protein kinase/phosphatase DegS [compost metagenome]